MLLEDVLTRKDAERYFTELCDNEIKQSRELYERFMLPYRQSGSEEMVNQLEADLATECQAHMPYTRCSFACCRPWFSWSCFERKTNS